MQKFVDVLLWIFILNKADVPNFSEYFQKISVILLTSGSSDVTTFVFTPVQFMYVWY